MLNSYIDKLYSKYYIQEVVTTEVYKEGQGYFIVNKYSRGAPDTKRILEQANGETIERVLVTDFGKHFADVDTPQLIAVHTSQREYWRLLSTKRERQAWLAVWQGLPARDRLAYAGHGYGDHRQTALMLGYDDLKSSIMTPEKPGFDRSALLTQHVEEVGNKMVRSLMRRRILPWDKNLPEWQRGRRFNDIENGVVADLTASLGTEPSPSDSSWSQWYQDKRRLALGALLEYYNYSRQNPKPVSSSRLRA